jgi:hypothetical protein
MEKSYKAPNIEKVNPKRPHYAYLDAYNKHLCLMIGKPIINELSKRKQSKMGFINELNKAGLNYTYMGFNMALKGLNNYAVNFNYFGKIYEYLELPFPSLEYLNSFD